MRRLRLLTGARVLTPDGWQEADVLLDGGSIADVGANLQAPDAERQDLSGLTLTPGFIDLHVHGGGGFEVATLDAEEIRQYARWVVQRGVTGFLATVVAGTIERALDYVRAVAGSAGPVEGGASVL